MSTPPRLMLGSAWMGASPDSVIAATVLEEQSVSYTHATLP